MNQAFDPLNLLILAIAVVVFLRLRSVLGKRTGNERPPFDPYAGRPAEARTGEDPPGKVVALPNAKRPASNRKIAASGQAVGNQTRMRAAPSTTRAASLIKRSRKVANSAVFQHERLGAAARRVCSSQ